MTNPIDILSGEHRLIEKVLDSLQAVVQGDAPVQREIVSRHAEFFQEFADRCHHGKEEEMLFVELASHGMPSEGGPLGCMRHEHDSGRALVGELVGLGEGDGPLSDDERGNLQRVAGEFINLLRAHIQKEDQVLFPMALRKLPASVVEDLGTRFETFRSDTIGAETYDGLQEKARALCAAQTPLAEHVPAKA
jgi:hemerythrin-like domain-containing protein